MKQLYITDVFLDG